MIEIITRKRFFHVLTCLNLILLVFPLLYAGSLFVFKSDPERAKIPSSSEYKRIICAAPSVTEIVFALGLGDRVIGISHFTVYPPEAKEKTSIGGLINPSKERIAALRPDLVITQGKHESLAELCKKLHIPFLSLKIEKLKDIERAVLKLGNYLGASNEAQNLSLKIKREVSALSSQTGSLPKKRVFLCLSHTPGDLTGLMTTGKGTFLNEIIEMAGGINIFSDLKDRYPRISKESLIMREPDIIIEIYAKGLNLTQQHLLRKDWDRLAVLPAVQNSRIYFLIDDYLLIPGVRVHLILEKFIKTIHPEVSFEHD
ncbi:MAG: ABC transporter substrate-binding protein [Candidatus Aminicenantes bacterium]|nr:ABC transporter substrate-binding protein [Candidatus Aminicenantes bacterium]